MTKFRTNLLSTTAVTTALLFGYSTTALGVNAAVTAVTKGSVSKGGAKAKGQIRKVPPMFTQRPGGIFRGQQPGRDPERRRVWPALKLAALRIVSEARALRQRLEHGGGQTAIGAFGFKQGGISSTTPTASGGAGMPGEGSAPAGENGAVNTKTGNRTKTVALAGWTARGGMAVPFALTHNSIGAFDGSVGKGWSHSYEAEIAASGGTAVLRMPDGLSLPFTSAGGGAYTSAPGHFEVLAALAGGGWTLTFKDRTVWTFGADGLLTKIADRSNNTMTMTRNGAGFLTGVTDPTGRQMTFTYDAGNRIETVTDPMNRVWTLGYDAGGDLKTILYPDPQNGSPAPTREFSYDGASRIVSETDLRGEDWTTQYDAAGQLWKETNPLGQTTTYTYNASSTRIDLPLALGTGQVHNYSAGVLASRVDEAGFSEAYTSYNTNNQVLSTTDKSGKLWKATYDGRGNLLTKTDPLNHTWTYTYAATNERLTAKSPLLHTTTYTRDAAGRVTKVTDALGHDRVRTTYNSHGQPTEIKDALGRKTELAYDPPTGNMYQMTSPAGIPTYFSHDADGVANASSDAASKVTSYGRDGWGRATRTTHPGGAFEETVYDGEGNPVSMRDGLGRTTHYEYDGAGRLTGIVNPKGEREDRGYNANGWLGTVTDGNAHLREHRYNPRGEVYQTILADGTTDSWSKTGRGETGAHTRPDGTLVQYTHDGAGNLKLADYPGATPDESYTYDADDRRKTMADAVGTTEWTFDAADRLERLAQPYGATEYEYDIAGGRKKLTEVGAGSTDTAYDAAGRLKTVTNRFGEVTTFSYGPTLGRLESKAMANGTVEEYGYDGRDRRNLVTLKGAGGATLRSEGYVYDDASQITARTVDGVATGYGYDAASQLESESRPGYLAEYTHDANGNRKTRTVNGTVETLDYDAGDKLMSVKVGGVTVRSYGYNAAGSATSVTTPSGTTTVAWDEAERAKTMSGPGFTGSYGYNGMGTRLAATENGAVRHDLRDGAGVTAPVLTDGTAAYTPGLSERRSGTSTFLVPGVKNVAAQTGASGAVSATRQYDAFGNVLASTGAFKGPFGYGGAYGYREDASGLKLLGHRLYDSAAGRFLSRDPARDGRNWYAYCGNDPVNRVDPQGLDWHNPTQVWVSPGFKGTVTVVGEPGRDKEQVAAGVMPGYQSHPKMDVDLVLINYSDGRSELYFIPGWEKSDKETGTRYYVDKDGDLHGGPAHEVIRGGLGIGGILQYGLDRMWSNAFDEALERPLPKDRLPLRVPHNTPTQEAWDRG